MIPWLILTDSSFSRGRSMETRRMNPVFPMTFLFVTANSVVVTLRIASSMKIIGKITVMTRTIANTKYQN
ncbi:hypothetical protein D9M68_836040 [compost metagenome]